MKTNYIDELNKIFINSDIPTSKKVIKEVKNLFKEVEQKTTEKVVEACEDAGRNMYQQGKEDMHTAMVSALNGKPTAKQIKLLSSVNKK